MDTWHGDNLEKDYLSKVKDGKVSIDARLDLHGMTLDEAFDTLTEFITEAHAHGLKRLLVITGKGKRGEGAIKTSVPKWLNNPELRPLIKNFDYADQKHGGNGALYVFLAKISPK